MKHGPLVFLGVLLAMAVSWTGLVLGPQLQLGGQQPAIIDDVTGQAYPPPRPGLARQGMEVYRANGCVYCHSQQVRYGGIGSEAGFGKDFERGWGKRWSVDRDYLHDAPVMLGEMRIGPDLANIGLRRPDDTNHVNQLWQLQHLYNPQITSPGSTMPRYSFLFEKRKIGRFPSPDALKLPAEFAPEKDYEIVPKPGAMALVGYLFSLHSEVSIFESTLPQVPRTNVVAAGTPTPPVPGSTNAPGPTNAPAK